MTPLAVCPECQRHLRRSETTCPFCDADVREAFSNVLPRAIPTERLGRTALMAFAAANLGVAACGGQVESPQPVYGAPAPDASFNTGGAGGSNTGGMRSGTGGRRVTGGAPGMGGYNTGGAIILPPYGIAPIPPGSGGDVGMAEYGAPPPPPGSGGIQGAGAASGQNAGGATNTGGDMGVPIYGAAPPKP